MDEQNKFVRRMLYISNMFVIILTVFDVISAMFKFYGIAILCSVLLIFCVYYSNICNKWLNTYEKVDSD
jgi:hypothetical protein